MCYDKDNIFIQFCNFARRGELCSPAGDRRSPLRSEVGHLRGARVILSGAKPQSGWRSRTFPPRSRTMLHIVRSSLHSDFDCAQDDTSAVGRSAEKHRAKRRWNLGRAYDAFAIGICAALSIFSMKMPYPVVGSLMSTCVTAPTSLPF